MPRIRVQRELRDKSMEAGRWRDLPAAQMLREFMRDYAKLIIRSDCVLLKRPRSKA